MKKIYIISTVAFAMLSCMAFSPRQSLQARLFGFWAPRKFKIELQFSVSDIDLNNLYLKTPGG